MRFPLGAILLVALAPTALSIGVYTAPPHFLAAGEGHTTLDATTDCEADGNYAFWWEPARVNSPFVPDGEGRFTGLAVCDGTLLPTPVHALHTWSERACAPVGRSGVACEADAASFRLEDDGSFFFHEVYSDGQVVTVAGRMTLRQGTNDL